MYSLLIVDDESYILDGLREVAENSGLAFQRIRAVSTAREALELFEKQPFDLLLTDISMPGMDGLEMVRRTRSIWPFTEVIFLTGYQSFEYARSAVRLGGFDYLLKPITDEDLVECLKRAVKRLEEREPDGERQEAYGAQRADEWGGRDGGILRMGPGGSERFDGYSRPGTAEPEREGAAGALQQGTGNPPVEDAAGALQRGVGNPPVEDAAGNLQQDAGELSGTGPEELRSENALILLVQDYIRRNPGRDLSLGALSRRFHASPSYLSRTFHQVVGTQLSAYITESRVEEAKRLLSGSDERIYEIARKTGFDTPGYFAKVFSKQTGMSPKEYRLRYIADSGSPE